MGALQGEDSFLSLFIRERGSVLYLGMAREILKLCITQIMAKEATNPKPSTQRE